MRQVLNDMQRIVANVYAGGDYRILFDEVTTLQDVKRAYAGVADGLFVFLMKELSDQENCESVEDALQRLHTAEKEIRQVAEAIAEARRNGGDDA